MCVCAWAIWRDVKLLSFAEGSGPLMSPLPTKLLMSWEDIGTDHPDVPALLSNPIFVSGNRLSQEPACQFFKQFFKPNWNFRTSSRFQVETIWLCWMYSSLGKGLLPFFPFCTGYGDGSFLMLLDTWSVFARKMHSTTKFAMTVLSKCVTHGGFVMVAWTLRGIPF